MKKYVAALLSLTIALPSFAGTYTYHPESWLTLGSGINPYYPTAGYADCMQHDGEERKDFSGVRDSTATLSMIKTRSDFYKLTKFSASIAGSYKFISAGGSYREENEDIFHSDSLTWIVFFESNYGIFGLKNLRLKDEYKKLTTEELYATCGSEIVKSQKKTAMAYALFTLHNVSESHRREVEAHFSAGAKTGIWSASMKASFESVMRSATAAQSMTVKVKAIGGNGIADLSSLVGPATAEESGYEYYKKVPEALKKYVEGLNAKSASASEFQTASVQVYNPKVAPRYDNFKSGQVGMMFTMYEDAESIARRAASILSGRESVNYLLTTEEQNQLDDALTNANNVMNTIFTAAEPCFTEKGKCIVPEVNLLNVRWPSPKRMVSMCEYTLMMAVEAGCMNGIPTNNIVSRTSKPICTSYDPGTESIFSGWKSCTKEELEKNIPLL